MRTLYELTGDFLQLLAMAEDETEDIEVILNTIEGVDYEIEMKAEGYAKVVKELEARSEALKKEEERLSARRKSIENNIKRMKQTLQQSMEVTGKTKFKTELFSFNVQNNPPSLVLDKKIEDIPEEYLIPQPAKVDNAAVKELLKSGEALDFAHLSVSKSLRIR